MSQVLPRPMVEESDWYRRFTFGSAWEVGWNTFKAKYPYLLKVSAVYLAIYVPAIWIGSLLDRELVGDDAIIDPVDSLAEVFLVGPLAVGFSYAGVAAVRGREISLGDLFNGFQRYWTVVGISAVIWLLNLLIFVPVAVLGMIGVSAPPSNGFVLLLLLVPFLMAAMLVAIYLSVRLWFAALLAIDPGGPRTGVLDSVKLSWTITQGRALTLFLLGVATFLVFLLTLIMLLLPALLVGVPLGSAIMGAAYAQIVAEDGVVPLESSCVNCGYPNPSRGVCPECGLGAPQTAAPAI